MGEKRQWTITVCPTCGRDDRITSFTGKKHSWRGSVCPTPNSELERVVVAPVEDRDKDFALRKAREYLSAFSAVPRDVTGAIDRALGGRKERENSHG